MEVKISRLELKFTNEEIEILKELNIHQKIYTVLFSEEEILRTINILIDTNPENEYIKYHFDNKKEYYILHLIRDNINYLTITLSIVSEYKKNNKKMIIAFLVKIPNHRFGKELFQNLGVIE